ARRCKTISLRRPLSIPMVGALAYQGASARRFGRQQRGQKGSDKGIDGAMVFTDIDERTGVSALRAKRVIVQVRSGHVKSGDIRDLVGAIDREQRSEEHTSE